MVYFNAKKRSKKKAVKAIGDTVFYPDKGKRLLSMVEGDQTGVSQDKEFGVSFTNFY